MGSARWSWCVQSQARVAARSLSTRGSVCVSVGEKLGLQFGGSGSAVVGTPRLSRVLAASISMVHPGVAGCCRLCCLLPPFRRGWQCGEGPPLTRAPRCCATLSTATFLLSVGVSFWFCPTGHIKFLFLRSRWHGDFHIFLHCSKPQRSGVERPRMCQCTRAEWSDPWVFFLSFLELD